MALAGENAIMPAILRKSDEPYEWEIVKARLDDVANVEKRMPDEYISEDGFGITQACRRYLQPLISGEDYPPYVAGLPDYIQLKKIAVPKKLDTRFELT